MDVRIKKLCLRFSSIQLSLRHYWESPSVFGRGNDVIVRQLAEEDFGQSNSSGALFLLLNAYRRFGFMGADLDPLKLHLRKKPHELNPRYYGIELDSLDDPLHERTKTTLGDLINQLELWYCHRVSLEFMHLRNTDERKWLAEHYENTFFTLPHSSERILCLKSMIQAKVWEQFLGQKFPTLKRYSGEGAESVVSLLKILLESSPDYGIQQFIFGGAHRGRLAIQTTLFDFPPNQMFRKIRGLTEFPSDVQGVGDVLTHQQSHFEYSTENGEHFHVSALPNPSHLEASLPVIIGKARGKAMTMRLGDYDFSRRGLPGNGILCVIHHGDGAFTGQGVVWETLNFSQTPHFRVGGSIHLIVNNQLAFTAERETEGSFLHVSDMAKAIDSPIIHVNGDDTDNCIRAAKLALQYRDRFRKDIFINLVCYRKHGHNELDDPTFTNPRLYDLIKAKKCPVEQYTETLDSEKIFSKEEAKNCHDEHTNFLSTELDVVDSGKTTPSVHHLKGVWAGFEQAPAAFCKWDTGFNLDSLKSIGLASVSYPDDFDVHPNVKRAHVDSRRKRFNNDESAIKVDWSSAEALAFGSILLQQCDIRLSGQDVGRGTFSHRHAMFVDQKTGSVHIPLNNISESQTSFLEIANSPLSEASILGFEYGVSIDNPRRLVIWEAQFGDFYNGAQTQIDTLISTGESKWLLNTGLIMLLPHGFDGAGPDHSSAHSERFLQLTDSKEAGADGDNVNINPTTSAQYFHLLRRQIVTPYRKPMIIISPKLMLRHPSTLSDLKDFAPGKHFKPVLVNKLDPGKVKKVVFTSGKHASILMEAKEKMSLNEEIAIVRLEQLSPFPIQSIEEAIKIYSNSKKFIWSQEEPRNSGAWSFVASRFKNAFGIPLEYVGRPEMAHMATSIGELHKKEIEQIISDTSK